MTSNIDLNPKVSYSILNNYDYQDKPFVISFLDVLSTPVRRILGGTNVSILSLTYEPEMSSCMKGTIIISCIITVVGIAYAALAIIALAVKALTLPWLWQKNTLQNQYDNQNKLASQFDLLSQTDPTAAIQLIKTNPELCNRKSISDALFKIINNRINEGAPLSEIKTELSYLSRPSAQVLILHTFKTKLQMNPLSLNSEDITSFIDHSLEFTDAHTAEEIEYQEKYYIQIIENLALVPKEDILVAFSKMALADKIINHIIARKNNTPTYEGLAKLYEPNFRSKVVSLVNLSFHILFNNPFEMCKLHNGLKKLQELKVFERQVSERISNLKHESLNELKQSLNKLIQEFSASFQNDLTPLYTKVLNQLLLSFDQQEAFTPDLTKIQHKLRTKIYPDGYESVLYIKTAEIMAKIFTKLLLKFNEASVSLKAA